MIKNVKINEERIAVLIGKHGKVKKEIETYTRTKISVSDEIIIEGEAIDVLTAENIVRAIGRGFAPETALELLDEENTLFIITLDTKNSKRIKARIIGTRGKTRERLEKYTRTFISVYGKTISIIGTYRNVETAQEAVEKFIKGASHTSVYMFLEKKITKITK